MQNLCAEQILRRESIRRKEKEGNVDESGDLQAWLRWNITNTPTSKLLSRWPWGKMFGLICWMIWKNRCTRVFEGGSEQPKTMVNRVMHQLSEEVENDRLKHKIFQCHDRSSSHWSLPPNGYVRLDVDGSVISQKSAACGGLVRDDQGNWVKGFQQKLNYSPPTAAELSAIHTGLRLCKSWGFHKVKLFSDSIEAIHLLFTDCGPNHPLKEEINHIRSLIYSDWELEISHVHKNALKCADFLAKTAHGVASDICCLDDPPTRCRELMNQDVADFCSLTKPH